MIKVSEKSMQAVVIDRFGGPETIRFDSVPVPKVGPDEVLIHIESAGVGVWDPFEREGGFARMFGREPEFPYVLGTEGAGTVAAVGRRVRRFKPGDRVYAAFLSNPKGGFYAEYTAMPADNVSPIPQKLTTEQAGVMLVDAITALRGLDDAIDLKPGESVMIFGASGGIGHLAIQLAKRMGARVLAVASGEDGVALAQRLGADAIVDGHKDDVAAAVRQFAPGGLDAALVTAGGEAADKALTAMRDGAGRLSQRRRTRSEGAAQREDHPLRRKPRRASDREAQPLDRVRTVRGVRCAHFSAGAGRRGTPGARGPLPRQAGLAAERSHELRPIEKVIGSPVLRGMVRFLRAAVYKNSMRYRLCTREPWEKVAQTMFRSHIWERRLKWR